MAGHRKTVTTVKQPELIPPEFKRPSEHPEKLIWTGEVMPQKWMNIYTKILTNFVHSGNLKLKVSIEVTPPEGVTNRQIEETKAALKKHDIDEDLQTE